MGYPIYGNPQLTFIISMTVSPCRLDLLQSASNMPTTLGWYGITKGEKKKDGLLEGDDSHSPTDHLKDENPMVKIWSTVEIYELF